MQNFSLAVFCSSSPRLNAALACSLVSKHNSGLTANAGKAERHRPPGAAAEWEPRPASARHRERFQLERERKWRPHPSTVSRQVGQQAQPLWRSTLAHAAKVHRTASPRRRRRHRAPDTQAVLWRLCPHPHAQFGSRTARVLRPLHPLLPRRDAENEAAPGRVVPEYLADRRWLH